MIRYCFKDDFFEIDTTHRKLLGMVLNIKKQLMEDMYLTPQKKEYYQNDFEKNVLTETHEIWKINPLLVEQLNQINKSPNIQTLYSCIPDSISKKESYLQFTFVEEVEKNILRNIIPSIMFTLSNIEYGYLSYYYSEPRENIIFQHEENTIKMGCFVDPDYFRINHIKISYINRNRSVHPKFWEIITSELSAL